MCVEIVPSASPAHHEAQGTGFEYLPGRGLLARHRAERPGQHIGLRRSARNGGPVQVELVARGGVYRKADDPWVPFAIVDERVVTGQNPASGGAVADLVLAALK